MDKKDITTSWDFSNLTNEDIQGIEEYIQIEFPGDLPKYQHLYSIRNVLFDIPEVHTLLADKLFAGRTSIKWYTFDIDQEKINRVIEKLEDSENNYFETINEDVDIEDSSPQKYVCIKLDNMKYLMRIIVPGNYRNINTGTTVNRIKNMKNVVTIVDLENKILEIRADYNTCNLIKSHIYEQMLNTPVYEYEILSRYHHNMEEFAYDLNNGKFTRVMSIPNMNIELGPEEEQILLDVIEALNKYFNDRNLEELNDTLDNVDLSTNTLSFTQLLLAGLSKIGISTRIDIEEDLTSQVLYEILRPYMTNQKGHISFQLNGNTDNKETILVGINTKSVSFKTFASEASIDYIRSKLLGN